MADSPRSRPLSLASVRVLAAIAQGTRHGFDIMENCELPSGTVYPILARLEHAGLIRGKWEAASVAQRDKRPPRRYYEISAAGSKALAASTAYYRSLGASGGAPEPGTARG